MASEATRRIVRDALANLSAVNNERVARAALREVVRQLGRQAIEDLATRTVAAYIDELGLPFDGRIARKAAIPAVRKLVQDALDELEQT